MTEEPRGDLPRPPMAVEQQVKAVDPNQAMPGRRAALRRGVLRDRPPEPQGDENREPAMPPAPPP